jgi:hypothetical protein
MVARQLRWYLHTVAMLIPATQSHAVLKRNFLNLVKVNSIDHIGGNLAILVPQEPNTSSGRNLAAGTLQSWCHRSQILAALGVSQHELWQEKAKLRLLAKPT